VFVLAVLFGPLLMGGWMGAGVVGPGMMGWGTTGAAATVGDGWPWAIRMLVGALMMLVFWGAVIVGVVLLVRWATGPSKSPINAEDPLTILRRRYAAGDIDQPTFERMSSELSGSGSGSRQPVTTNGRTEVVR